jgi:hypothetical protein
MSVDAVDIDIGAAVTRTAARTTASTAPFEQLAVGQQLELMVLRRLGSREYLVALGAERHVVESAVELAVGARVRAEVAAVDERLTLRYLDAATPRTDDEQPREPDPLEALAARHAVTLAPHERAQLDAAAADAADPARLILSGLYLTKLGLPLDPRSLHALYAAQLEAGGVRPRAAGEADATRAQRSDADADSPARLEQLLGAAFDDAAPARAELGSAGGDSRDDADREGLVRQALNLQDGGSVGYRYATLPLLIGGELAELQVALFTPRHEDVRGRRVRRLVMTLDTPRLHEIRIETKSVDERIAVAIDASTPAAVEALAAREGAVRELLAQLGWAVEAVSYGVNVPPDRAARRIVDHVLSTGTVDETY